MSGARNRLREASMMRIAVSGAAWRASLSQTPSDLSRSIELVSSAAVRVSTARAPGAGAGPIATTSAPTSASASAATRPDGPVPTTASRAGQGLQTFCDRAFDRSEKRTNQRNLAQLSLVGLPVGCHPASEPSVFSRRPLWQERHRAKPFQLTHKQRNGPSLPNSTRSVGFITTNKALELWGLESRAGVSV